MVFRTLSNYCPVKRQISHVMDTGLFPEFEDVPFVLSKLDIK